MITSKNTSINSNKIPTGCQWVVKNCLPGQKVLDYGCGKYYNSQKFFESNGFEYYGYDPYNRTEQENHIAMANTPCGIVICSNVLNVIPDEDIIRDVIRNCLNAVCYKGIAVFTVYEGNRSGVGRMTKADCWQRNQRLADYLKYFEGYEAEIRGKILMIRKEE